MKVTLDIPTGEQIDVLALRQWPGLDDMVYLQSVRRGMTDDHPIAKQYHNMRKVYPFHSAEIVAKSGIQFDSIVRPRSSRHDAEPYFNAIAGKIQLRDFSDSFTRRGDVKSADSPPLEALIADLEYHPNGMEKDIRSLLIVDEFFASGASVAVILHHLRTAGMPIDARVTVAVPAIMRPLKIANNPGLPRQCLISYLTCSQLELNLPR